MKPSTFPSVMRGAVLAGCVLMLLAGCGRFASERVPKMKWLILPFEQPAAMSSTPRAVRGWWFGARTIRQNPRAGVSMADALARQMGTLDYVHLFSPIELKYYFADKRQLLTDAYPYLDKAETDQLLAEVPALDYGRELGADKILTGRIIRQYMGENRTIHWWWSRLEVEAQVLDVASGQPEWTQHYVLRDQFASMNGLQEEAARRILADLKKGYFRPLAK